MTSNVHRPSPAQRGSIIAYVVVALVMAATIASIAIYVSREAAVTQGRKNLAAAYQFADGGSAVACNDLERAYTANSSNVPGALTTDASFPYVLSSSLSTASENCYTRTITTPFTGQSVAAQIWLPKNTLSPTSARVVTTAAVGTVSRTVTARMSMIYGWGAAIVSTSAGTYDATPLGKEATKSNAQNGNVAINAGATNTATVDGEIFSNGTIYRSDKATVAADDLHDRLYYPVVGGQPSANRVPDYTNPGSSTQLFDFDRFIAASKAMNRYYSSSTAFISAMKALGTGVMEGIITVDLAKDMIGKSWDTGDFPNGINIRGTLVLNFSSDWQVSDKLFILAPININAANLTGLTFGNPATYTTGYPPTFTDATKKATAVNIAPTYANFGIADDLPAIMYKTGICDFHGPVNICGAVYSPGFAEIENKNGNQIQYIRGSIIVGSGVLLENTQSTSKSIVSFDSTTVDNLATAGINARKVRVVDRR
jgi:hypothetical protein